MQKRTREILALVLLLALAVIGVSAMAWYILVGHNWNVAASNIDDSIGQMDGYTVILCESAPTAPNASPSVSEGATAVDVDAIAADYRQKGASVLVVDTGDLARHREPYIVKRAGKRIGVFSVENSELRSEVRADVGYLEEAGADVVIALSNDLTLGKLSEEGVVAGLSAIVFNDPRGVAPDGEYRGSAYCIRVPENGQVAAVILSPSGVYSSKVIDDVSDVEEPVS